MSARDLELVIISISKTPKCWVSLQNKCLVRREVGRFVLGSGSALVLLCDFSEIDVLAPVQGSWCSGHSECPVVGVCSGQADEAS